MDGPESGARLPHSQGARPGPEMTNCPTTATALNEFASRTNLQFDPFTG